MRKIQNSKLVVQALDFNGVEMGRIYPSDCDWIIELDNKFLILGEVKYKGTPLKTGQRLMLERISDNWSKADEGNRSVVLKCEHEHPDENTNIPLRNTEVTFVYKDGMWERESSPLIPYLNRLGKEWECKKLKIPV